MKAQRLNNLSEILKEGTGEALIQIQAAGLFKNNLESQQGT